MAGARRGGGPGRFGGHAAGWDQIRRSGRASLAARVAPQGVRRQRDGEAAHLRAGTRDRVLRSPRHSRRGSRRGGGRLPVVVDHPGDRRERAVSDEEGRAMIVTRKAIPRRTILRGLGATVALPLLDAMVPAFAGSRRAAAAAAAPKRLSTIYVGNGANMKMWTPAAQGADYQLTPMLEPLAAFRDRMLVISGLDNRPGLALPGEPAGGHGRIGGSYLTGVHVKPTEGADSQAGISIDQIAARELGRHTQLASLELSLDTTEFAGACDAGFSCAYTTTLCWRGPTSPIPMEHDPRAVFERLFGDSGSTNRSERLSRLTADRSILDSVTSKLARLQRDLGSRDREKLSQYVEAIRDVERRIQRAEEQSARELPVVEQPAGAPDGFEAYARLMFDLQVLAFQSDLTRVITFMLAS